MPRPSKTTATPATLAGAPGALADIYGVGDLYSGLDSSDLRETAKHGEQVNVYGIAAHPISRPMTEDGILESPGAIERLPERVLYHLRTSARKHPTIALRFLLAGSCARPFVVTALVPISAAHVALTLQKSSWPAPASDESQASDLFLIIHPEYDEATALYLPEANTGLVLGCDDPRVAMMIAIEAASRKWSQERQAISAGELPKSTEPIVLLEGGSFPYRASENSNDAAPESHVLTFPGESIPVSWEASLMEASEAFAVGGSSEILLAEAEPWVAEGGGKLTPFWKNPPLPACLLRESGRWKEAALSPGSVAIGMRTTGDGHFDWTESADEAFFVTPRKSIPAPFANAANSIEPARLLTHRAAKPEAMELWALGFPSPELI